MFQLINGAQPASSWEGIKTGQEKLLPVLRNELVTHLPANKFENAARVSINLVAVYEGRVRSKIEYCTKSDRPAIVVGIPVAHTHYFLPTCGIYFRHHRQVNLSDPFIREHRHDLRYIRHAQYWKEIDLKKVVRAFSSAEKSFCNTKQ